MMSMRSHRRQSGLTLVELLVGIVIMGVVSTMLIMIWFSLQNSYAYSVSSSDQRDSARQALSRLQAEVRDAQAPASPSTQPALLIASPYWIEFDTTFNTAGDTNPTQAPRMVMYRLYRDGTLWRFEDLNGNGSIAGVDTSMTPGSAGDVPTAYSSSEETTGEGARLLLKNLTNYIAIPGSPVPLFRYMYYDQNGVLQVANSVSNATYNDRSNTVAVLIHMLEDLNPGHSPIYADLQVTAQLRNQR
jgi:prepilin-type N-terminal cleavage/methylation domain-containing protein